MREEEKVREGKVELGFNCRVGGFNGVGGFSEMHGSDEALNLIK